LLILLSPFFIFVPPLSIFAYAAIIFAAAAMPPRRRQRFRRFAAIVFRRRHFSDAVLIAMPPLMPLRLRLTFSSLPLMMFRRDALR